MVGGTWGLVAASDQGFRRRQEDSRGDREGECVEVHASVTCGMLERDWRGAEEQCPGCSSPR